VSAARIPPVSVSATRVRGLRLRPQLSHRVRDLAVPDTASNNSHDLGPDGCAQPTYRHSWITAACRPADPAAWRSAIRPDLRPLGGRAPGPILEPYALTALPTHLGETRSRTATAPARTGPPVRNDNRGAVRPIQPDGTGLSADDLGLAVTGAGGSRSLRPAGIRAATLVVRWRGRRSVARPCKGRRVDRVDRTE
jgi:hypothetical protein